MASAAVRLLLVISVALVEHGMSVPSSSPQNVMVVSVDLSSLVVSWQPPPEEDHNGVITGYVIQYTRVGISDAMNVTVTSGTTHTITGLVSFVNYSIEVAAMTTNGTGPFSTAMVQVSGQDIPSVPRSLMVDSVTDVTVTLSWMEPDPTNGDITEYQLQYRLCSPPNSPSSVETVSTLTHTVTGLVVNTEYCFRVRAVTRVGNGNWTTIFMASTFGPPNNVGAVALSPRSIEVTWDPSTSPDVNGYLISYNTSASYASNGSVMVNDGSATSGTIANLEENTLYVITVQAVRNSKMSGNSNEVSVTTLTDVPSSSPQNVMVVSVDPSSLVVSWQPPPEEDRNGVITGYVIQYTRVGISDAMNVTVTSGTTRMITGLVSFVNYSIEVAAMTTNGTGPFSTAMVQVSGQDIPSVPRSLMVDSVTDVTVTLSWMEPDPTNGDITEYQLQYRLCSPPNSPSSVETVSTLTHTVTGLVVNTEYCFRVRAVTRVGNGNWTTIFMASTFGPPNNVGAVALSPRSIEVTWDPSTSPDVNGYLISYNTSASYASNGSVMVNDGSATSGTIANLEENTLYAITVQAVRNSKMSGNSNEVSVTTLTDVPSSSPQNVMVTSVDRSSLMVSWQPPPEKDRNGVITGYVIQYTRVGTSDAMNVTVTSGTTRMITGLVSFVTYSIEVAAMTTNGTGPFSTAMVQVSGQDIPSVPRSLMVDSVTDVTVTLSWMEPDPTNGDITGYQLGYGFCDEDPSSYNEVQNIPTPTHTVDGLVVNTEHCFRVRAVTRVGNGNWTAIFMASTFGPPNNVGVVALSPRSIEVTWDPSTSPDVNRYLVSYDTSASYASDGSMMVNDSSATSGTITNLEENTLYVITVQAVRNSEMSGNSNEVSVTTLTDVPSSSPQNVMVTSVDRSSLMVSWQPPPEEDRNGVITGYVIQYIRVGTSDAMNVTVTSGTTRTISSLVSFVTYSVEVAAMTTNGTGPFSTAMVQVSGQDIPSVPRSLMVDSVTDVSVTLSWMEPDPTNGDITEYQLQYRLCSPPNSHSSVETVSTLTHTVTGLVVNTEYCFRVRAVTRVGNGNRTGFIMARTYSPPTNVAATTLSPRSIEVTWDPPVANADDVNDYIISYDSVGSFADDNSTSVGTSSTTATIDGLEEFVSYDVTVQAVYNGAASVVSSNSVRVQTYSDVPDGPPCEITLMDTDPAMLSVRYRPPEGRLRNGEVIGYVIRYTIVGTGDSQVMNVDEFNEDFQESIISGLVAFTNYSIEVAAVNVNGTGQYSDAVFGLSGEDTPTAPHNFRYTDITTRSISVSWQKPDPPNGVIINYTVSIALFNIITGEISDHNMINISAADKMMFTFTDLMLYSDYQLNVTAYTRVGPGLVANLSVMTLPDVPPPPPNPNVADTTSTTSVVMIQQGSDINGPIQYYAVVVIVGAMDADDIEGFNSGNVGPYNEANRNQRPYGYIAGIVATNDVTYPYSYTLGDGTTTSNGQVEYVNIPLQPGTVYYVLVRAHTSDEMFSTSGAIMTSTNSDDSDKEIPIFIIVGAAAGGVIAIITLIVIIICLLVCFKKRKYSYSTKKIREDNKTSGDIQYTDTLVLQNFAVTRSDTALLDSKSKPVIKSLSEEYVAVEGKSFTFPIEIVGNPMPQVYWYLNNSNAQQSSSVSISSAGQLTIGQASKQHEGVWKCQVTNSSGTAETMTKLTVKFNEAVQSKFAPVPTRNFGKHVELLHMNNNEQFVTDYESLYNGEGMPSSIGSTATNKFKNRFANIIVYDSNRIVLAPVGDCTDEYINASPIDGYEHQKRFIATQGPTDSTVVDFWRLIWQERSPTIVMVTNLQEGNKTKCSKYWPEKCGELVTFGPLSVFMEEEEMLADYVVRTFQLKNSEVPSSAHTVVQYHFTAWPDHGVPDYGTGILAFHRKVLNTHCNSVEPMIVHCSAGVGRTGTLIAIDIILKQVEKQGLVDIYNIVNRLRYQRPHIVQTLDQYMFIHDAILESITCGNTQISTANLQIRVNKLKQRDGDTNLSGYEQQFKVLEQVSPRLENQQSAQAVKHNDRNRPKHCLPVDKYRVILKKENLNYINASYVKGYKQERAFVVAQSPMQNTVRDFWKMVHSLECASIIMLCEFKENDKAVCAPYWRSGKEIMYGDDIMVKNISEVQTGDYTQRVFNVTDTKSNVTHQVNHFHYQTWSAYATPTSSASLLAMIEMIQKVQRRTANKPIMVHCSNALGRSGTFCAIFNVLEKLKLEKVVDVFQTVKLLRIQRPGSVEDLDQYCFIYSTTVQYLQTFETYSNFE